MDTFISNPTMHNYASNQDRIPVIQLHNQVKQSAATTDHPSSSILNSVLATFPIHAVSDLPKRREHCSNHSSTAYKNNSKVK